MLSLLKINYLKNETCANIYTVSAINSIVMAKYEGFKPKLKHIYIHF